MTTPQVDRFALMWLLGTCIWVVAPLVMNMPWWLGASLAVLLAWNYLHAMRGWPLPGRILRTALMVLLLVLIFRHYHTLFGRDAGVALLLVLCGLKLLEARGLRDYIVTVLVLMVLAAGQLLFSQGPIMAVYALGSVVLVLAALSSLQHTAPALGHLRLAGGMVMKAVPLAILVFVLFPRLQGGLWPIPSSGSAVSGMSDSMRPGSLSRVSESDAVVFRVEFDEPPPPPVQRYWRTLVFNAFDGQEWTRGPGVDDAPWQPVGAGITYSVISEPSGQRWLSALDRPGSIPADSRAMPGYVLERGQSIDSRVRYRATSYLDYRSNASYRSTDTMLGLQLPRISSRTQQLAQSLGAGKHQQDAIEAVLNYFHTDPFSYSLRPPRLGDDPVDEFLFETRVGYCEHYASAFVTLARAMGIPARVVVGYQGGETLPGGNYLVVRQMDAHAWAEVWLAPKGWVRVDPTSAVAPERVEYGADAVRRLAERGFMPGRLEGSALARAMELPWLSRMARGIRQWWDSSEMSWDRWVAGYSFERQQELLARLGLSRWSWNALISMLVVLVGVLLVALAFATAPRAPSDPVQAMYKRFCAKLARVGLLRNSHEGPLDFANRCSETRPDLSGEIDAITRAYLVLRYGAANDSDIGSFRRQVHTFKPTR